MSGHSKELIFVYNADAGQWNAYMDMLHKVFSPKTYPCSLCAVTYGVFSIRPEWAAFVETIPAKLSFLHRDEWELAGGPSAPLPAVFLRHGEGTTVWIDADTLNGFTLAALQAHITARFGELEIMST